MSRLRKHIGPNRLGHELTPGTLGRRFETTCNNERAIVEVLSVRCDDELFDRAVRRLETVAELEHPHLVPVLDAGLDGNYLYTVSAQPDRTAAKVQPSAATANETVHAIANALSYLHECGIIHRNVQPANVGWYRGVVKLGGLGLVDVLGAQTHGVGPIGALTTMAPSLVHGAPATIGSDLYSLGATVHLIATGVAVHPLRSESVAERICRIGMEAPTIDPLLESSLILLVDTLLAADGITDLTMINAVIRPTIHPDTPNDHVEGTDR